MSEQETFLPAVDELYPFSHWVTPKEEKWRYDTHFYFAQAPDHLDPTLKIDKYSRSFSPFKPHRSSLETTQCEWFTPSHALRLAADGEISLPPPTYLTLMELNSFKNLEDLANSCRKGRDMTYIAFDLLPSLAVPLSQLL